MVKHMLSCFYNPIQPTTTNINIFIYLFLYDLIRFVTYIVHVYHYSRTLLFPSKLLVTRFWITATLKFAWDNLPVSVENCFSKVIKVNGLKCGLLLRTLYIICTRIKNYAFMFLTIAYIWTILCWHVIAYH